MAQISPLKGRTRYCLRQSFKTELGFFSKDLFELGKDPSKYLVYPGGNAFYVDEEIEKRLSRSDLEAYLGKGAIDSDALEALFWPFVRPEIRRAVETFQSRGDSPSSGRGKLTEHNRNFIRYRMPRFDKRRLHFLKFGRIDQGPVENMPDVIFKPLLEKSRDEIEQYFLHQEMRLKSTELKSYLYASLDIQRFFKSFMAKRMPHAMDQEAVDTYFIDTLCLINHTLFHEGLFDYDVAVQREALNKAQSKSKEKSEILHPYLRRYVIMFFDHDYDDSTLLDDFARRFMNAHRARHEPPPKKRVREDKALKIMELSKSEFQQMTLKELTRHYRKLAGKHHPDRGGSDEAFVQLNEAYESLLERL